MNDMPDMQAQLRNFYARGNMLIRKFMFCSINIKKMLFKAYCGSFYCCSLWCVYTDKMLNRIRVAYNNTFRKLFGLPRDCSASEMFVQRRVSHFLHVRRSAMFSLTSRVTHSDNIIIKECVKLSVLDGHKSPFWHLRDFLLYPDFDCRCRDCRV